MERYITLTDCLGVEHSFDIKHIKEAQMAEIDSDNNWILELSVTNRSTPLKICFDEYKKARHAFFLLSESYSLVKSLKNKPMFTLEDNAGSHLLKVKDINYIGPIKETSSIMWKAFSITMANRIIDFSFSRDNSHKALDYHTMLTLAVELQNE